VSCPPCAPMNCRPSGMLERVSKPEVSGE
jgi:hypothetical protein